jgi:hypothetical protein
MIIARQPVRGARLFPSFSTASKRLCDSRHLTPPATPIASIASPHFPSPRMGCTHPGLKPCHPSHRKDRRPIVPFPQDESAAYSSPLNYSLLTTHRSLSLSPLFATLTGYVTPKSFICHSYKKLPGVGVPSLRSLRTLCASTPQRYPCRFKLALPSHHTGPAATSTRSSFYFTVSITHRGGRPPSSASVFPSLPAARQAQRRGICFPPGALFATHYSLLTIHYSLEALGDVRSPTKFTPELFRFVGLPGASNRKAFGDKTLQARLTDRLRETIVSALAASI